MNILSRLKKLEESKVNDTNRVVYLFKWRTEDIKSIKSNKNIIYKNEDETICDFKVRAESELLTLHDPNEKFIVAWAD